MAEALYNFIVENDDLVVKFSCASHTRRIDEVVRNLLDKDNSKRENDPKVTCRFKAKTENVSFSFDGIKSEDDNLRHQAVFFENTDYPLLVKGKHPNQIKEIRLHIADHKISETDDKGRILSDGGELYGTLNFRNQVGETDFRFFYKKVDSNKEIELAFETEVLSYKLDYRSDLQSIIRDVEQEYAMLSYSFMKETYLSFRSGNTTSTDLIWWQIFKSCYQDILTYASVIIDRPKRRLRVVPKYERAERLPFIPQELENEYHVYRDMPAYQYRTEELVLSHDTIENRFLKYALKEMAARFVNVRQHIMKVMRLGDEQQLSADIQHIDAELLRLVNHPFFRGVGVFKGFLQDSLVMKQAYGYKEIMQCWIKLQCGYELEDGTMKLEVKDVSELYEIWCFIKVKNIVQEILGDRATAYTSGHEVTKDFIPQLLYGKKSEVEFINDGKVTLVALQYNAEVKKEEQKSSSAIDGTDSLTTKQRPDIVLRLSKEGGEIKYTYLFDAKYRIDDTPTSDNNDAPPEDAIDQMHRYRDSIYYTADGVDRDHLRKEIVAGYVLFPGNIPEEALDAETGNYYYLKSSKKIGIGAFPLRPNKSEYALREQIRKWIDDEDSKKMLLEMSIPQKGLDYVDEHEGKGPYFLSSIDPHVNPDEESIVNGDAKSFVTGYSTIYAGVDFQQIKYYVPVKDHKVYGFYKVNSYEAIDASETLLKDKETKFVKAYKGYNKPFRIKIDLCDYTPLSKPFTYGIDRNAARGTAMSARTFKEYCNKVQAD